MLILGEYKLGITQAQLEGVTLTREDGNPAGDLISEVGADKERSYTLTPVPTVPFEGHVIKKVTLKFDADIVVGIQMFFAEGEDISGIEKMFIKKYGEASCHERHEGGMQLSWSKRPVELAVMCGDRSTTSYVKLVTDKYSAIAKENFAKISETFKKQNVPDDATFNALKAKGDKHKSETLVFKGFYLGMPIEDEALVVNYYSREKPCQLVRRKDGSSYINSGTIYVLSDKQGQVTKFKFCKEILHKMFDSERMPHQEFLQTFIKAYDVPSLSPVIVEWKPLGQIVGSQTVYTHQSDKGYYLKFFDAKEIYDREGALSANLAGYGIRKYGGDDDGVMLLETATERQSAFD